MHRRVKQESLTRLEDDSQLTESSDIDRDDRKSKMYWEYVNHRDSTYTYRSILRDPSTPYLISLYLQLGVNLLMVFCAFYFLFRLYRVINSDIQHKISLYTIELMEEAGRCRREYERNRCGNTGGNSRIPALERMCIKWRKCMDRDPVHLGTGKIAAETVADIVNGFFVHTTWKSLIFLSTIAIGTLVLSNMAFGTYRRLYEPRLQPTTRSKKMVTEHEELIYDRLEG